MFLAKRAPRAPLYSTLTTPVVILDATGLRDNTTNAYGVVANGFVSEWIGIAPGTAHNFTAGAVGTPGESSLLKFQDGYIEFPGYTVFGSPELANTFNFMHYNSTFANLKWTIHIVLKIGQTAHPNALYALFGNNATGSANKGTATGYDDRILVPNSDGLGSFLTAGGGVTIITSSPDDLITPNVPFVYTEETDCSQAAGDRRKHYINGTLFAFTVTSPSTAVQSGPTYQLGVGQAGNKTFPFRGWISHVILQQGIESAGVRSAFINSLLPFKNKSNSNYFYQVDESRVYSVYHTLATTGRYYFVQGLIQSPTDPNKIIKIYHNGDVHIYDVTKRISQQISSDMGRTWATEVDVYDEDASGPWANEGGNWGWESSGRIHGFTDWHTSTGTPGGSHKMLYHYSDDSGATYTTIDVTSLLPADGLIAFRNDGSIIEGGDGFIYSAFYKFTDEGDTTQSALYLLRKPVGASTTWTVLTIKAAAAGYRNEMSLAALDETTILILVRDDDTKEWHQYHATNNGATIADIGAASFGETLTNAGPPLLTSFYIGSAKVIAAWLINREAATKALKVVYGLALEIKANGYAGWVQSTKFTVVTDPSQYIMYGRVCHYENTFNAIGAFARDPLTNTENTIITFHCPATNYYNTKAALGL